MCGAFFMAIPWWGACPNQRRIPCPTHVSDDHSWGGRSRSPTGRSVRSGTTPISAGLGAGGEGEENRGYVKSPSVRGRKFRQLRRDKKENHSEDRSAGWSQGRRRSERSC